MPVRPMNCPSCGRGATEYDASRWRCLFCDTKFVYEPPPAEIRTEVVTKDGLFICESCKQARDIGEDSAAKCDACGKLTCLQCITSDGWGNPVCRDCAHGRHLQFRASIDGRDQVPTQHFLASFAWLGIIAATIAIPVISFRALGPAHLFWAIPIAIFAFAFLFARSFSPGGDRDSPNPLTRFFGSLIRLIVVAGIPVYSAFLVVQSAGILNLIWVVPVVTVAILVLAAAAMEI